MTAAVSVRFFAVPEGFSLRRRQGIQDCVSDTGHLFRELVHIRGNAIKARVIKVD